MRRTVVGEWMDRPGVARKDLDRSLRYIRFVNQRLGGTRSLLAHLEGWSEHWPRGGRVTLLDVGTGSADIAVAARRWARGRGFDLRVTGVDIHPTTLDLARLHVEASGEDGITLVEADAFRLIERFEPRSFDYVHAGMFLHHLGQVEMLTVLRIIDRLARRGIVWNDLLRSRASLAFLAPLLVGQPPIVRHDARASIRAGFRRVEVLDAARRVGIDYATFHRHAFGRFTLAGERPAAWDD